MERIHQFRTSPYALHGSCLSLAAVMGGRSAHRNLLNLSHVCSASGPLGLPHEISASILALGEGLIKLVTLPQNTFDANLAYCESGWILIGAPVHCTCVAHSLTCRRAHIARLGLSWPQCAPTGVAVACRLPQGRRHHQVP